MKIGKRILVGAGCALLLIVSWLIALQAKSGGQKQAELLEQAQVLLDDGVYVRAEPLLEEAAGYSGPRTVECEEKLKLVYLNMLGQQGYTRKYVALLEKQMGRKDPDPAVFRETAEYYFGASRIKQGLEVLRDGIEKTHDEGLVDLYEANRYAYTVGRAVYDDVTEGSEGAIQVKKDGLWGLAKTSGKLVVPCEYDKVSTFSGGQAIVQKGSQITAVDEHNNRLALLHQSASDFGNYSNGRLGLRLEDGWHNCDGEFHTGSTVYEEIGMFAQGYAAAKKNGKWGVMDRSGEWYIEPEYDAVAMDELGRCYGQDALFVRKGNAMFLVVDGEVTQQSFEDAQPFGEEGYAAVKRNGLWGFIDTSGEVRIDFQYEEALSFGQHLAAVKIGDGWGYISLRGEVAIEPQFLQAKSFCGGSAPVYTVDGWEFLILREYEAEVTL